MITLNNISISFSGEDIFSGVSLVIGDKDRIGLVGKNGAGKSTLMKIISGTISPSSGNIVIATDQTVGYLPQELQYKGNKSVIQETITAFERENQLEQELQRINQALTDHNDYESKEYTDLLNRLHSTTEQLAMSDTGNKEGRAERILCGLGFQHDDMQRNMNEFSTGWQMRVELAKILLKSPDVILLDEPTNHLDIQAIDWLENFLKEYPGALLLVSHDRAFLDNVTTRTVEITAGKIYDYKVPYSQYVELMQERRNTQLAQLNNQQKEIAAIEQFIERFRYKATKAKQVQSRLKQLEKMERVATDETDTSAIHFQFPPAPHCGKIVLEIKHLSKNYEKKEVLRDIELLVTKGEKVAFVGRNGEGKSTLAKIIVKEIKDYIGDLKLGHGVSIGYYAQNQAAFLDGEKTVYNTINDIAVGDIRPKIRNILGAFLFSDEDIDKKVSVLSGGEKARLALAKLLLTPVNLLVLDEPTNHLDMVSKDILKNALLKFDGTLILVSHDRDFLEGLTETIYEFKNKKINLFKGDIYEFLEAKKITDFNDLNRQKDPLNDKHENKVSDSKRSYLQNKEQEKKLRKQRRSIEDIEEQITRLENELKTLETELYNPSHTGDFFSGSSFYKEYEQKKEKLEKLLSRWEELHLEYELMQTSENGQEN